MRGSRTLKTKDRSKRLKTLLPKLADGRFYIPDEVFEAFRDDRQPHSPSDKPNGLWYSVGDHWFDFILNEAASLGVKQYVYQIEIDTNFVLKLEGAKAIDDFTDEYKAKLPVTNEIMWGILGHGRWIEWSRVAQQYGAIEIAPYCWERRLEMRTSWDVASGCIWDNKVVKKVTLVEDLDE